MPYIYAIIFLVGIATGWQTHSWKSDAQTLAVEKATKHVETSVSKILETKLADIKANERTIIREIPTVINNPVYHNECLDITGLRNVNASKSHTAKPAG